MIEGHDILCFAPGPWDDIWRNRHHIMSRLARANRVLYVEPWPYLYPTLRRARSGQIHLRDLRGPRLDRAGENLYVYQSALWVPRADHLLLGKVTQAAYMSLLRRALRRMGFERPILWLFLPDMEVLVGGFGEKLVVYHIVDEYAGYTGISEAWRPVMQCMEQQLARRSDLVFVTSQTLLERKRALNAHTFWVPNGVDYEAFAAVVDSNASPPDDIATVPAPVVGYVGAINDKVDLALLARTARKATDWSLALVGPIAITDEVGLRALEELQALAHVHFLGRKGVTDVPRYVAACSVCVLPYRVNEWTRSIDSLKLYEYLACGKPVVATDVPAAHRFPDAVRIATDEEEFATSIHAALLEDSPALRDMRRSIAAQHTWDQRVTSLSAAIEGRLRELERLR